MPRQNRQGGGDDVMHEWGKVHLTDGRSTGLPTHREPFVGPRISRWGIASHRGAQVNVDGGVEGTFGAPNVVASLRVDDQKSGVGVEERCLQRPVVASPFPSAVQRAVRGGGQG